MNKKHAIYAFLLLILTNITQACGSQQDALLCYVMNFALLSGGQYLKGKIEGKRKESTMADAPPHFQQWARKILAQSGLENAETIPLKIDDKWASHNGLFISAPLEDIKDIDDIIAGRKVAHTKEVQDRILDTAEFILLHEKKHYSNGDWGKRCLIRGSIAAAILSPIAIREMHIDRSAGCTALVVLGGSLLAAEASGALIIPYVRDQEKEADRYAFMNVPIKNLTTNKYFWQHYAGSFEKSLSSDSHPLAENSLIKKPIFSLLSQQLRNVDAAISKDGDDTQELHHKREKITRFAYLLVDPEHPYPLDRAELAQECLNKRKAEHREKFVKSSIEAVLGMRGIKK